jgi:hypothetical protein
MPKVDKFAENSYESKYVRRIEEAWKANKDLP